MNKIYFNKTYSAVQRNPLRKQSAIQKPASAQPCLTAAEDRELEITVQRIIQ